MILESYRKGWRVLIAYKLGWGEGNPDHDVLCSLISDYDLPPGRKGRAREGEPLQFLRTFPTRWRCGNKLVKRKGDRRQFITISFSDEGDAALFKLRFENWKREGGKRQHIQQRLVVTEM